LGEVDEYTERGVASWYGKDFHGRKTSNGEIYDMYARTAAHRILPFGTQVEVTNLGNGKRTTLRINDRGPFVKDRIIDLSYTGALDIGLVGPGTAPVEIKAVGVAESSPQDWNGNFAVQVGAFGEHSNAALLQAKLSDQHGHVSVTTFDSGGKIFYRVRVGRYQTLAKALEVQKELASEGYGETFIVAE
jgi:rare lipoprotein A